MMDNTPIPRRSNIESGPLNQPSRNTDNPHKPTIADPVETTVSHKGPSNNNAGEYTKMKGTRYLAMPMRADSTAVAMGEVPAMAAAAKDAKATGGVMVETTPK